MKTILPFLIISFIISNLNAQFAPEGATWYYGEGFAFSGDISYMKFVAEGDTIIQGKLCQKIRKYGKVDCLSRPILEFTYDENGTIFFYNQHTTEFDTLFDFNASPGNAWIVKSYEYNGEENEIEVSVDSVGITNVNGVDLKILYLKYHIDFLNNSFFIPRVVLEKIGDLNYMFYFPNQSFFVCDSNYSTGLRCYEDEDLGHFETGIADSCTLNYIWVGTNEFDLSNRTKIYPNPVSDIIIIEADAANAPQRFLIRDVSGKLVKAGIISNKYIQLDYSQKGLYFLELYSEDGSLLSVNKFVKH